MHDPTPPPPRTVGRQAGVLAHRTLDAGPVILLVSARSAPDRWTIPKGWIEPGESPAQAAAREAWEEGGIVGLLTTHALGRAARPGPTGVVLMDVYGLAVTRIEAEWPEGDVRTRRWIGPAEAADLLHHPDLAELIERFAAGA